MGKWKWLSIALLVYCIAIIFPYAGAGGGSNDIGDAFVSAVIHNCPVDYAVRSDEDAVTVLARIEPGCAVSLSPPSVALIGSDGETIAEAGMRGAPNGMRARLNISEDHHTDKIDLILNAALPGGETAQVNATEALRNAVNNQPKE